MGNCRGIFLTNIVSKVWERRIILNEMHKRLKVDIHQNGGQNRRGTMDNLMAILTMQDQAKKEKRKLAMIFKDT